MARGVRRLSAEQLARMQELFAQAVHRGPEAAASLSPKPSSS